MTTSGVIQSKRPISELIDEAFDYCQIAVEEESLTAEEYKRALNAANMMMRTWQGQGFHLWQYTEGTLFVQSGRTEYNFKPEVQPDSYEVLVDSRFVRSIRSDVIGQAILSKPYIGADDLYYVMMPTYYDCDGNAWASPNGESFVAGSVGYYTPDRKIIDWRNVLVFTPVDPTVTPQELELPDDGREWAYWSIETDELFGFGNPASFPAFINIPTGSTFTIYPADYEINAERLLSVRRVNNYLTDNENETPIKFDSHQQFEALPTKNSRGVPNVATFDRLKDEGCLKLWQSPQNECDYQIRFTFERTFEKFVNTTDTADFPRYWEDAFIFNLAERLALKFRAPPDVAATIRQNAMEYLNQALDYDNANYDLKVVLDNRVGV